MRDGIAIVGFAGLFPGAPTLEALWRQVVERRDASRPVPEGRWLLDPETSRAATLGQVDRVASTRGYFLDPAALEQDADLDGDRDLGALDPLARLVVQVGARAWRSARTERVDRARAGAILANIALPTEGASRLAREVFLERSAISQPLDAWVTALPAGLLARKLGLGLASFTLDAACASSLYALALACDELLAGRADCMLAGGASRPDPLYTQMGFSQLRALSPRGRCSPFDRRGDGLVVGEGAGVFVLKRLEDALAHGDRVRAVIRGVGLSNDVGGKLLAPDSEGQLRAMRAAYEQAGWDPRDVDLIECHATGTPVGDAVELASLRALWGEEGWREGQCVLGAVKACTGHLLTGAGAAGLAKTLLALEHATLPPQVNFEQPVSALGPFRLLASPEPWRAPAERPRRAAVSGFGFGGINAHLLLEELSLPVRSARRVEDTRGASPIAIVGMEARFASLKTLREFQEAVLGGKSALRERPDDRWRGLGRPCLGGWLDPIEVSPGELRIPPAEIAELLPQQLLMLQVAKRALEDAKLPVRERRLKAGAIVGLALDLNTTNFHLRWASPDERKDAVSPPLTTARTLGALGGLIASRIARELELGGASFGVSGEGSSGLRALEVAARLLQRGELDLAVAGAVDLAGDARAVLAADAVKRFSRHAPRPFDAASEGTVPGEGAAALVLKRLEDAERDGDRIYAVLRGIGAASDYEHAIERAYEDAQVEPETVSYVETHGSGDPEEDALEARALAGRFKQAALGSVKPIVGNAGAASGLASVVKAALCLYQEVLPPLPGFERPRSPMGDLHVPRAPLAWLRDREDGPRRAAVSALSVDGSFLHAVLEGRERVPDAHAVERRQPLGARPEAIFAVEADDESSLAAKLDELHAAASRGGPIERLARVWLARRAPAAKLALAIVAGDAGTLARRAREAVSLVRGERESAGKGETPSRALARVALPGSIFFTRQPVRGDVAFVFPGSGSHYVGMGRGLGVEWPEVLRALDTENERLASQLMPRAWAPHRASWESGWEREAEREAARDPHRMIFGQVTHGVTVSDVLRRFVAPQAAIGYSLGESTALFALRAWRDRDGMLARMLASPLFASELAGTCEAAKRKLGRDAVDWRVVLVNRSKAEVEPALSGAVWLLIVNAPDECVLGGLREDLERTLEVLGAEAWPLEGVPTVHCPIVEPVEEAYRALHRHAVTPPRGVRFYSGVLGRSYELTTESAAESITAQALRGFDFPALIDRAHADSVRVFVECGPQGSATRAIARILGGRPHVAATACVRGQEERTTILRLLARLISERVPVDLGPLYGEETLCVGHREPTPRAKNTIVVPLDLPRLPAPVRVPAPAPALAPVPAPAPVPVAATDLDLDWLPKPESVFAVARSTAAAHETFLATAQAATATLARAFTFENELLALLGGSPTTVLEAAPAKLERPAPPRPTVFMDRAACLEFARGKIGNALGATFAPFDAHPTRVRLPDEPLMLVDRIVSVEGTPLGLDKGRVVTEHDVLEDAWYLDAGRAPVCISVEAGQADLFLSAYLGIDRETKGERRYRLLDAVVTFHRALPRAGETIRYDIKIDRFVKQGSTYLFFFQFDGTVAGEKLVTMRDGCAGFFSQEQLRDSAGIVLAPGEEEPRPRERTVALAPMREETLDSKQLDALRRGDLAGAFGADFAPLPLRDPVRLPGAVGRMKLIDRVVALEPRGGRFGLGLIRAEADVRPDDWFLTCHFTDDMVMPGTLMYECCLHALRVYLTRLGWVGEGSEIGYEPIPEVASRLRCRGQVTRETKTVAYEIHVKELGYRPEPYAIADALMFADGKRIVRMENMSVRLDGLTREKVEALWQRPARRVAFERERITAFAIGKPSDAFGDRYEVFDQGRKIARLPGPPFQLLDRIVDLGGARPWELAPTDWIEGEYDVPQDAWYFAANRQRAIPFSVILEIALQPCGWLAAYLGSALRSPIDLSFRNLGGKAVLHEELFADAGTLTTRVRLTSFSEAGGMIIQKYDMKVLRAGRVVYDGDTSFGFFSKEALAQQVGVRGAKPWNEPRPGIASRLLDQAPLPERDYRMIDEVVLVRDGGRKGLGFLRGTANVDPAAWFFKAHFYQDPVWPGSLGLESFLQLLKVFLADRHPELMATHRFETILPREPHEWIYRGQIIPTNKRVTVEATIDERRENGCVASGYLSVDGIVIYEMKQFGLRLVP
jgi:acyl transferase domain-containing protein/3-hydroxymyristoyl/3-hydroxydecanoyl-(acyl carrier protein) dehydratase